MIYCTQVWMLLRFSFPLRHAALVSATITCGFAQLLQPQPAKILSSIPNIFASYGIEVSTSASDTAYADHLSQYLSKGSSAELGSLSPYCVWVKNHGTVGVSRIVVRYVTKNPKYGQLLFGENSVDIRQTLRSQDEFLITPTSVLTQKFAVLHTGRQQTSPSNAGQFSSETLQVWRGSGVAIHIDSIVLEDGSVLGPDLYGVTEEIPARRRAVKDMVAKLNTLGDTELDSYIQEIRRPPLSALYRVDGSMDQVRSQALNTATAVYFLRKRNIPRTDIAKTITGALERSIRSLPSLTKVPSDSQ